MASRRKRQAAATSKPIIDISDEEDSNEENLDDDDDDDDDEFTENSDDERGQSSDEDDIVVVEKVAATTTAKKPLTKSKSQASPNATLMKSNSPAVPSAKVQQKSPTPSSKKIKPLAETSSSKSSSSNVSPAKKTQQRSSPVKKRMSSSSPSKVSSQLGEDDSIDVVLPPYLGTGADCTVLVQIEPSESSILDFEGASGAIGRLETDNEGGKKQTFIYPDMLPSLPYSLAFGYQYRGILHPGPTAMVVSLTKNKVGCQQLKVESITDEFVTLHQARNVMAGLDAVVEGNIQDGSYYQYVDENVNARSSNKAVQKENKTNEKSAAADTTVTPSSVNGKRKNSKPRSDMGKSKGTTAPKKRKSAGSTKK
eukprot:scaffold86008_cov54-Attheya_sp.AAC.2